MRVSRLILVALSLLLTAFGALATTHLTRAAQRSVEIRSFTATPTADGRIQLNWETARENDSKSFHIKRAISNTAFISETLPNWADDVITVTLNGTALQGVTATAPGGTSYQVFDENVSPGQRWYYAIVELETTGAREMDRDFIVCATAGELSQSNVSATNSTKSGSPGSVVSHDITIRNIGNQLDTYVLQKLAGSWLMTITKPLVTLAGNSGCSPSTDTLEVVTIEVQIPQSATSADSDVSTVNVQLSTDPTIKTTAVLTTTVVTSFDLYLPLLSK